MFNKLYNLILEYPHYDVDNPVDLEIEKIPEGDIEQLKNHLRSRLMSVSGDLIDAIAVQLIKDDTAIKAISRRFGLSEKGAKRLIVKVVKLLKQDQSKIPA